MSPTGTPYAPVERTGRFTSVKPDLEHTKFFRSRFAFMSALDARLQTVLTDPRDTIFVYLLALWSIMFIPTNIYFFALRDATRPWAAWEYLYLALHVGLNIHFSAPMVGILHCVSHAALFKKSGPYSWINTVWVNWVVCPLFGQSPNTYYCHHLKMHHVTGNGPDDLSSTMAYERDNVLHFILYFCRFYFLIIFELPLFFIKRQQWALVFKSLSGEAVFWGLVTALAQIDTPAALILYAIPYNAMRVGMMSGNWGQHAFIDPLDPDCEYSNSLTVINVHYNWIAWNDGYHTSHHLNPIRHWADHPKQFIDNVETYSKKKTIVFEGLDFHGVWFALMRRDYALLAQRYVRLPGDDRTDEQVMSFLKSRTRPMSAALPVAQKVKVG